MTFNVKSVKRTESESSLFKMPKEEKFKEFKDDNSFEEDKLARDSKKLDEKMESGF